RIPGCDSLVAWANGVVTLGMVQQGWAWDEIDRARENGVLHALILLDPEYGCYTRGQAVPVGHWPEREAAEASDDDENDYDEDESDDPRAYIHPLRANDECVVCESCRVRVYAGD